jgi:hypothetical protein
MLVEFRDVFVAYVEATPIIEIRLIDDGELHAIQD